jgi:hypothetical protein
LVYFTGMGRGLKLNFYFCCVQSISKILGIWDGTLPVELWNINLWHVNPPGGVTDLWPRVSGFTNEPAYLGILLTIYMSFRFFFLGISVFSGWCGLYFFIFQVFLINSRTSMLSYILLILLVIIGRLDLIKSRWPSLVIIIFSVFFMPIMVLKDALTDINLTELFLRDISIFARSVPLIWIYEGNNLSLVDYILGVSDYRIYANQTIMDDVPRAVFEMQSGDLDAKSLSGAYFFDFGFLGISMFIILFWVFINKKVRFLFLFLLANVAFFNVYAFSWPLYWICLVICLKFPEEFSNE